MLEWGIYPCKVLEAGVYARFGTLAMAGWNPFFFFHDDSSFGRSTTKDQILNGVLYPRHFEIFDEKQIRGDEPECVKQTTLTESGSGWILTN
jgi:hypothetical protein